MDVGCQPISTMSHTEVKLRSFVPLLHNMVRRRGYCFVLAEVSHLLWRILEWILESYNWYV